VRKNCGKTGDQQPAVSKPVVKPDAVSRRLLRQKALAKKIEKIKEINEI